MNTPFLRCAGLMTGTSMDGLDLVIADIHLDPPHLDFTMLLQEFHPYPDELRGKIHQALDGSTALICEVNYDWGRWVASVVKESCHATGIRNLDLVASHGQTLYHIPGKATLQIGETAFLARDLGVPVISDFRAADIAAGGSGAPLMPWVDGLLFGNRPGDTFLLNVGGVANVTRVPGRNSDAALLGFDTGPGMALLDEYYRKHRPDQFDRDGDTAARGQVDERRLGQWMMHPFFSEAAPKSTGRDVFGPDWIAEHESDLVNLKFEDALATLAALTAASVADALKGFTGTADPLPLHVSGGGARHGRLMKELSDRLPRFTVAPLPDEPLHPDMKEAFGMAVYGAAHILKIAVDLSTVTGARASVIYGKAQLPAHGEDLS